MKNRLASIVAGIILATVVAGMACVAFSWEPPAFYDAGGLTTIQEAYESRFISSADNTVVKAGPGILAGIKVTGGTMGTVTVYDNTTCAGTVIDNAASTDIYAGLAMPYGSRAANGICVYTSAATKLVVIYK
jgi:hypothetical protein